MDVEQRGTWSGPGRTWAGRALRVLGLTVFSGASAVSAPVTREDFARHRPVQQALDQLYRYGWFHSVSGGQPAGDLCWAAVVPEDGLSDANVDRCLQAAVQIHGDGSVFRRTALYPKETRPAGLGVSVKLQGGRLAVTDALPGTPAEAAGVVPGEFIEAIDGRAVAGQTLDALVGQLRGEPGTQVQLQVVAAQGAVRQLTLTRRLNLLGPVYAVALEGGYYLQVGGYSEQLVPRIQSLLAQAERAGQLRGALVVDLRGNTGGMAQWIVDLAKLLAPSSLPALYTVSAKPMGAVTAAPQRTPDQGFQRAQQRLADLPLVVLVDRDTGSGTEGLAEIWRQQAGALVVGQPTAGLAQVKQGFEAFEGARFEVPVGVLHAGGGLPVHGHGVQPEVYWTAGPVRIGRPPEGLDAWLREALPQALRQRQARRQAAPPSAPTGTEGWACLGPVRLPPDPGLGLGAAAQGHTELTIDTERLRWTLTSDPITGDPAVAWAEEQAETEARVDADRRGMVRHLQDLAREVKAQEKAPGRAAANPARASLAARQRLLTQMGVHAHPVASAAGPQAGLLAVESGRVSLVWTAAGRRHELQARWGEEAPASVRALLEQRLAHLQPDAGGPADPSAGLCVPGYRVRLDLRDHAVAWRQSLEQTAAEPAFQWHMAAEFNLPAAPPVAPALAVAVLNDDDDWLLGRDHDGLRCAGPLATPQLLRADMAGQAGVLRVQQADQTRTREGQAAEPPCRELRSVRRLPWGTRGLPWRAELVLRGGDPAAQQALQARWADALARAWMPDAWLAAAPGRPQ